MRFILTVLFITFSLSTAAHAGEIYNCGTPETVTVSEETEGVCDIYTRQLAYRLEANDLRTQIHARQENFAAPAIEARERYKKALKKLNEERGTPKPADSE
jgi:hypothetical protein